MDNAAKLCDEKLERKEWKRRRTIAREAFEISRRKLKMDYVPPFSVVPWRKGARNKSLNSVCRMFVRSASFFFLKGKRRTKAEKIARSLPKGKKGETVERMTESSE